MTCGLSRWQFYFIFLEGEKKIRIWFRFFLSIPSLSLFLTPFFFLIFVCCSKMAAVAIKEKKTDNDERGDQVLLCSDRNSFRPPKRKKKREKKKKNVRWIDEMSPFLGRDAVEILTKKKFFFFKPPPTSAKRITKKNEMILFIFFNKIISPPLVLVISGLEPVRKPVFEPHGQRRRPKKINNQSKKNPVKRGLGRFEFVETQ